METQIKNLTAKLYNSELSKTTVILGEKKSKCQCEGFSKNLQKQCSNKARHEITVEGITYHVCGKHNKEDGIFIEKEEPKQCVINSNDRRQNNPYEIDIDQLQSLLSLRFIKDVNKHDWYYYDFDSKMWFILSDTEFNKLARNTKFRVQTEDGVQWSSMQTIMPKCGLFVNHGNVDVVDDECYDKGLIRTDKFNTDLKLSELTLDNTWPDTLNLTQDIAMKAKRVEYNENDDCLKSIFDHIDRLSGGNKEWVLNWLSYMLRMDHKTRVSCAFVGPPGCGKSLFANFLRVYMFGRNNGTKITKQSQLTGRFNGHLFKKFGHVEEISNDGGNTDELKEIITGEDASKEHKGKDITTDNFKLELLFTLNQFRYKLDSKDRRFAVFEWTVDGEPQPNMTNIESESIIKDFKYWVGATSTGTRKRNALRAYNTACKFYSFLMDRDITFDPSLKIPDTDIRQQAIEQSKDSVELYTEYCLRNFITLESEADFDYEKQYTKAYIYNNKHGVPNRSTRLYNDYVKETEFRGLKPKAMKRFMSELFQQAPQYNFTVNRRKQVKYNGKTLKINFVK